MITPILYIIAGLLFVVGYSLKNNSPDPKKQKAGTVIYYVALIYIVVTLVPDAIRLAHMLF